MPLKSRYSVEEKVWIVEENLGDFHEICCRQRRVRADSPILKDEIYRQLSKEIFGFNQNLTINSTHPDNFNLFILTSVLVWSIIIHIKNI